MADYKHSTLGYGQSIVDLIEHNIKKYAKEEWKDDECPPKFLISINNEDMNNQKIIITISHAGVKFSENLFPRKNTEYGYNSVRDQMINMYNQTM